MTDTVNINLMVDAVDYAKADPEITIVFEAGANKLLIGTGTSKGIPCLTLTAETRLKDVGDEALTECLNATSLIAFHTPEVVDLFISHLQGIRLDVIAANNPRGDENA